MKRKWKRKTLCRYLYREPFEKNERIIKELFFKTTYRKLIISSLLATSFLNIKENTKHSAIKKQFFANFAFSIFSPKSSKL